MLKIRKLKIDITTNYDKKFGCFYKFETDKLNLVKGNNHSGKTTIASAIFYAMGMEQLLGGQNTKALDSILTSVVPLNEFEYEINESVVYLEIENSEKEVITIERYIKHVDIDSRIAYIYKSDLENISEVLRQSTYLHDGGSAQNDLGFYKYIENYLNYNLPNVPKYDGGEVKLYLQVVFNAFFVEQLKGWTDFFATIPNFGTKEAKKRIVEFILNLEAVEFEKNKSKYEEEKERIKRKWFETIQNIKNSTNQINANLMIKYIEPVSNDKFTDSEFKIYFINEKEEKIDFDLFIKNIELEVKKLNEELEKPKDENEEKLFEIRENLKKLARKISKLNEIISIKTTQLRQSKKEFNKVESEITKLTDLQKIRKYTKDNTITSELANNICPTCKQKIDESFYTDIKVMGIDENKKYLESQKSILKVYIEAIKEEIEQQIELVNYLKQEYDETINIIKYLEKDIKLNTNMATYKKIVDLEIRLKLYKKTSKRIYELKRELTSLSKEWKTNEGKKVAYAMSFNDNKKIKLLENYFKGYLFDFGYGSKEDEQIYISRKEFEKYFPIVQINERFEKIRINSSASDFVRSVWAYYISLFEVSKKFRGNHIGLFIFDEPAQHAMNESSQKALLERLSKLEGCQSIVFSSFEDKDNTSVGKEKFKNMIKDIEEENINILEIKEYSIEEID